MKKGKKKEFRSFYISGIIDGKCRAVQIN